MHDKVIPSLVSNMETLASRLRAMTPEQSQELLQQEAYLADFLRRFNDLNIIIDQAIYHTEEKKYK